MPDFVNQRKISNNKVSLVERLPESAATASQSNGMRAPQP